jgi:O-antigen/teichoic acid export membrane protein
MKVILQNTAINALSSIFDRGSIVLITAILSGALSSASFREFGQFQLTLTMLAAFSGVGISVSASRIFAEHGAGRSEHLPLIGTMWTLCLISALVLSFAALAASAFTPNLALELPPAALLAGVVFLALGIVANGGVLGLGLFKHAVGISMGSATVLVTVGALAAQQHSLGLAALAVVAAYGVNSALAGLVVLRRVDWRLLFRPPVLNRSAVAAVMHLIGPLAGVTVMAASGNWIVGQILLLRPAPADAFSGFVIGLQWFGLVQFIPSMLTRAAFPLLVGGGTTVGGASTVKYSVLTMSVAATVPMALATAAGVWIASPLIAQFYGEDVLKGGNVLVAFALAALPQSVANLLGVALIIDGGQYDWLWLTSVWFASLVLFALILAPWGAFGAAASLFVSGAILSLAAYFAAKRRQLV